MCTSEGNVSQVLQPTCNSGTSFPTPKPVALESKSFKGTCNHQLYGNTSNKDHRLYGNTCKKDHQLYGNTCNKIKIKIAHYGRSKSLKLDAVLPFHDITITTPLEEKRCSSITPNSDPIYVAYHDQEWGVPVYDDRMLFELLVLSGAQVGSDWTSILKKREEFREAFSCFKPETVSTFTDKHMLSISSQYAIEISCVRGVIDNSNRILEIKKEFGSFEKYIWGFVNNKPIFTQYKSGQRIPVKTSKSENISKDMVRRGFRFVGPTVVYSFMQAVGLTNDHLVTCHRHHPCRAFSEPNTA